MSCALGKYDQRSAALQDAARGRHRLLVGLAALDREGAEPVEQPALPALVEELLLRHEVDGAANEAADEEGVEKAAVVGREDDRTLLRDVLAAGALEREVDLDRGAKDDARGPEDERVHALLARALVIPAQVVGRHALGYPVRGSQLRSCPMPDK